MIRCTFLLALCCAPFGWGFQGTRVGMIDADRIIQESVKGKSFLAIMDAFSAEKRGQLKTKSDALEAAKKALSMGASLSEAKLKESQESVNRLGVELERMTNDAQKEAEFKLNTGLEEIRKEMMPLIRQVAIEKDLDLVLNMGPNSAVVYFHERIDITQFVIKKYDESLK